MIPEIFKARLLQIELERDAINAIIAGLTGDNDVSKGNGWHVQYGLESFQAETDKLRALQGDIKALMDEYQAGGKPAAHDIERDAILSEAWAGVPPITKRDMQFSAYWAGFHDGHMSKVVSREVIEEAFEAFLEGTGK